MCVEAVSVGKMSRIPARIIPACYEPRPGQQNAQSNSPTSCVGTARTKKMRNGLMTPCSSVIADFEGLAPETDHDPL